MTLLSIAIPSYNASQYLHYCVESLAIGGDDVEVLIINDGSSDQTQEIAEALAAKHANVRAIYQDNKGHGGAVNTGLAEAKGLYFKVVDSDDWVEPRAYLKVLETLKDLKNQDQLVDAFIANYVYEKEGASRKKVMRYDDCLPKERVFGWQDISSFSLGQYMLMHSLIYRTDLLRQVGLTLPEHTFYVDNVFAFVPLKAVETMYYLPVDFYRYLIGREDQSVNEATMIKRIDQQLRVNKLLIDDLELGQLSHDNLEDYLVNFVGIVTVVSSVLLNRAGTSDSLVKKKELWTYIKTTKPALYRRLRRGLLGQLTKPSLYPTRKIANLAYRITRRIYGFN